MKKIVLFLLLASALAFTGCNKGHVIEIGKEKISFENGKKVEGNDSYSVLEKDGNYGIFFYDNEGKIIDGILSTGQQPDITLLSDDLLKLNASTNDGAWYYDLENNVKSEFIMNVAAECGDKVAAIDEDVVYVYNVFDETKVMEISEFKYEFDSVSEPIVSVSFNEDGSEITVTYLDDTSVEVKENFEVKF